MVSNKDTTAAKQLSDLLAVLNGDGGHYEAEHGTEAAIKRAEARFHELRERADTAEAALRYYASPTTYCEGIAGNGSCDRREYAEGEMRNWTYDEGKHARAALERMGVDFKPMRTKTCSACEGFGYYVSGGRAGDFEEVPCDICDGTGSVQEAANG